jgi:hypothetical protein
LETLAVMPTGSGKGTTSRRLLVTPIDWKLIRPHDPSVDKIFNGRRLLVTPIDWKPDLVIREHAGEGVANYW